MKRIYIGILVVMLMVTFFSCKKGVTTAPVEKKPMVESVDEKTTKVEKPILTEAELFQRKTLEELNKQGYLKRVHFDFDKYFIREDMKPILEQNAKWLLRFPTVLISVGGHCDERGTEEYNMALGEKRADASKNYLVNLGVPSERINIVSYGKTQPLVKGIDEETHHMNRRDEFTITRK